MFSNNVSFLLETISCERTTFHRNFICKIEKDNFIPIFCNTPATQLAEFDPGPAMQYSHSSLVGMIRYHPVRDHVMGF